MSSKLLWETFIGLNILKAPVQGHTAGYLAVPAHWTSYYLDIQYEGHDIRGCWLSWDLYGCSNWICHTGTTTWCGSCVAVFCRSTAAAHVETPLLDWPWAIFFHPATAAAIAAAAAAHKEMQLKSVSNWVPGLYRIGDLWGREARTIGLGHRPAATACRWLMPLFTDISDSKYLDLHHSAI